jgi:hypothetical protein
VRIKEGSRVLATRLGLSAGPTTTYLDLSRDAVLQFMSEEEDWQRLERLPMTVEAFSDHEEVERSKVEMAISACAVSNVNKFIPGSPERP